MAILFPQDEAQKITKPIESKIDQLKKLEGEIQQEVWGLNDQILKETPKK